MQGSIGIVRDTGFSTNNISVRRGFRKHGVNRTLFERTGNVEKTGEPSKTRESIHTELINSDSNELKSSDPEFKSSDPELKSNDPQTLTESESNGLKRPNISNERETKRVKGKIESDSDDSNGTTSEENDSTRTGNDIDQ